MEDLLKLLDLPDNEFLPEVVRHIGIKHWKPGEPLRESLADLAFRLRDEAKAHNYNRWIDATKEMWKVAHKYLTYEQFWTAYAQPKHWIVAALIARRLARKE
ncbi:unnamed protein product [marine sediment metagenome]|uniref:Uncharacterized protein n=1 Tax=marine sediment metagenome TaxID=412755 RepID=X0XVQ4_9ZZZZ